MPSWSSWTLLVPPCGTPLSSAVWVTTRPTASKLTAPGRPTSPGGTNSPDSPAALGPGYDTSYNGGWDAFIIKLDAAGTSLRYATFPRRRGAKKLPLAWLWTTPGRPTSRGSPLHPTSQLSTIPGYDTSYNGSGDAFVIKLDATGTTLRYATFLGGANGDYAYGIAIRQRWAGLRHGQHHLRRLPGLPRPRLRHDFQRQYRRFRCEAERGRHHTPCMRPSWGWPGETIAVDSAEQAYVAGETHHLPISRPPALLGYDTTYIGAPDAFAIKLVQLVGTALRYAYFLGGTGRELEEGSGIVVDDGWPSLRHRRHRVTLTFPPRPLVQVTTRHSTVAF